MATPLYNVGTATLTAGSTAMVGQGTLWLGNVRPGDQVVSYTGQTAIVGTVNSNTSITLLRAYRGTSQTAQAYEILYTPDDPFTQQLAREVLQGISASALVKLGGVTPAARKLVHFDAAANAALADVTDFGLTLLDDADAAAARATLLLGGYATLNPGAFGWGADNANVNIPDNNADTLNLNGVYRIISSTVGFPFTGGGVAQLIHMGQAANVAVQVAFSASTAETQANYAFAVTRTRNTSGVWSSWRPVGSMSGSNANGTYVRVADGTQICFGRKEITTTIETSVGGNIFTSTSAFTFTHPAQFSNNSDLFGDVSIYRPAGTAYNLWPVHDVLGSTSLIFKVARSASDAVSRTYSCTYFAIGRWF